MAAFILGAILGVAAGIAGVFALAIFVMRKGVGL